MAERRIWFTSCIGVDYSPALIPHFLRHYRDLGIPAERFLLVLNTARFRIRPMRAARAAVAQAGVPGAVIWRGPYTSEVKQAKVRALLDRHVAPEDWIVHADADEFQEYPAPLPEFLRSVEAEGANVVSGVLLDRLAEDGRLRAVAPSPSPFEQFPVVGRVGPRVLALTTDDGGDKRKLMAYRGNLRANRGSGDIAEEMAADARPSRREGVIHHFKWTDDVLDRLRRRVRTYRRKGYGWWTQSQRFLDYYEEHGRIRLEDVDAVPPVHTRE